MRSEHPYARTEENRPQEAECQRDSSATHPERGLEFLSDVPLAVTAEIGRVDLTVRRLVNLKVGSLLMLGDSPTCEVTLRANGSEVARGEVVTVNDRAGVRITQVR